VSQLEISFVLYGQRFLRRWVLGVGVDNAYNASRVLQGIDRVRSHSWSHCASSGIKFVHIQNIDSNIEH
jgi:hypothetical protein